MTRNRLRRLLATVLLGVGGCCGLGLGTPVSARPMIEAAIYVLHGSGPFSTAIAWARVTHVSGDRFCFSLTAEHLPPPTILHVRFARHGYVAWLVNGTVMQGPLHMTAVGLVATRGAGNYTGHGMVTISGLTSVIITAEPTAQAYMPIMPVLTVLASAGHQL